MKISAELPTGVAALFFEAARERRSLESRLVGPLEESGYSEVILPVLDYAEHYEPFLTAASREELYQFVGRDGEFLALRSDFTPLLMRLLVPRLSLLDLPLRLFYRGDVIRYREEKAGELREFYQLGAELLSLDAGAADGEILRLFLRLLVLSNVEPLHVVLGRAGALDECLLKGANGQDASQLARAVARRDRAAARRASAALYEVVVDGLPGDFASLGPDAATDLAQLLALRDTLATEFPGVRLTVDLAEFARQTRDPKLLDAVGERSYYDGIIFRAHAGREGLVVGGGGRYDHLLRDLGAEVPAVGFSVGLESLSGARPRGGLIAP
jgi:ATP phosphoribosyltransferase regulatory subunit